MRNRPTEAIGLNVRVSNGPQFDVFAIGWHYHEPGDPDECELRFGFMVTILGITFVIGKFQMPDF